MTGLSKTAFFLICAIVCFTTLAYGAVHQPIIVAFYLLTTVLMVLWATDSLSSGSVTISRSYLQLPLLALGLYSLVQIIPLGTSSEAGGVAGISRTISVDPFSTATTAIHILPLCVFFFAALVYIDSAHRLRALAVFLTAFGFVYAFYAILQAVLSPDAIYGIYRPQNAAPFGSFVNKHDFAAIIEMTIAVPLGMLFSGAVPRDKRLIYVVAVLIMGTSLLLSGSRGGLVAVLAEILLLVIVTNQSRGQRRILLTGAASVLLVLAAVAGAIFVGGENSLTRFAAASEQSNLSSNRTHIWAVTLDVIREYLPCGAGLGAFGQAYTRFDTSSGGLRVEQAHNDYLQLAADAGIIGVLIGLVFLFLFIRQARASLSVENPLQRAIAAGAVAGSFAILVHSLFDFVLHITAISVMFLVMLGMLVAASRKFDDEIGDEGRRHRRHRRADVKHISTTPPSEA